MNRELLQKTLDALEIGHDCAIESLNESERMYSETFRPYRIDAAKKDLQQIEDALLTLSQYISRHAD